jgi:iron complex transport system substrate-binding protein
VIKPLALFIFAVCSAWSHAAQPQQIASLNMCLDQLLVQLVPKARIASVTWLSAHPQLSVISEQLDGLTLNHGLAEEIVPLQPDLILAGEFGALDAVALLQRLGYRVERLSLPRRLNDIGTHIREFGLLVGAQQRAEDMAQAIEQQLADMDAYQATTAHQTTAIWYSSDGVVIGADTLEHELLTRAGYRNLAAENNLTGFSKLDLEQLLVYAPQVIIVDVGYAQAFSLANEYLQHPALRQQSRLLELPAALSVCSAPVVIDALRALKNGVIKNGIENNAAKNQSAQSL